MIFEIPAAAIEWLRSGERGTSSEAIFARMTGVPVGSPSFRSSPPGDPADLRRCRLLLECVPEWAGRLEEMTSVGPGWKRIVAYWNELCALMDAEAPTWRDASNPGRAPKTYALMSAVLYPVCGSCEKPITDRPESVAPVVCAKCQNDALATVLARRAAEATAAPGYGPDGTDGVE